MIFNETGIPGAYTVELEKRSDDRGFFARGWCWQEFGDHGIENRLVQMNISFNRRKHTLRGFHYQTDPFQEDKLLRCTSGSIHDVMIDLRPKSPTYMRHISVSLTAENYRMLLVPKGCANAFLDSGGCHRSYLPGVRVLHPRRRTRRAMERPGI